MMLLGNQNFYIGHQEYTCKIPHQHMVQDKVYYTTLVMNHVSHDVKVMSLRYSDFKSFNEKLEKALTQFRLPVLLPQFPGKKLFGSTNKSLKSIISRRQELQDYMNLLLQIDKLYALPIVKQFLPNEGKKTSHTQNQVQSEEEKIDYSDNPFSFKIESYQQSDDIVLYLVLVMDKLMNSSWRFKTRYSDLRDIHTALKESKANIPIPEFPKRKIFGITNENPHKIEMRKQKLEQYLNEVFKIKELQSSEVLRYFIENSKRESQRLQKFDEQKMMARLKLKAQQIGEKKQGEQGEKKPKQQNQSALPKKGLFMIKEAKAQYEEDTNPEQPRVYRLDKIDEILAEMQD